MDYKKKLNENNGRKWNKEKRCLRMKNAWQHLSELIDHGKMFKMTSN